jgi:hypothetical protein
MRLQVATNKMQLFQLTKAISTNKILTQAKSAHPDGVFKEETSYASAERTDVKSTTSFSLKNNKKMLDLLTTCY